MGGVSSSRRLVGVLAVIAVVAVTWLVAGGGSALAAGPLPAGSFAEFPIPTAGNPQGIATGPDGNLWFTEAGANKIGRITQQGTITEFPIPTATSPDGIAAGPDGNLWFTEAGADKIGRITPQGTVTEFPIPTANSRPDGIAVGPDGNVWFTESHASKIGRITPQGTITEYPIPTLNGVLSSFPEGIAAGPDGNVWFAEADANKIGRITPQGTITEYSTPTAPSSFPQGIAAGPDGDLWFTERSGNEIGRITPQGTITEYPIPTANSSPDGIAAGPDGNVWFTENLANKIGRITPQGTITEYSTPTPNSFPQGISAGPDGDLWFTEENTSANKIGEVGAGVPAASLRAPSVTGSGQQGTEQACQGDTWSQWAGQNPSRSAFSFDGYQWQLDGIAIPGATSQTYTPTASDIGRSLTCMVIVTYPILNVTTSATSAAVIVTAQPTPPTATPTPPTTTPTAPTTTPTPAVAPAATSAHPTAPIKLSEIKLTTGSVIWCAHCTYPNTKLAFTLSANTDVRLKLLANLNGHFKQVATTTLHAHKGHNSFRIAGRWHRQLIPRRPVRILVQIDPGQGWVTEQTLKLTVRSPYTARVLNHHQPR